MGIDKWRSNAHGQQPTAISGCCRSLRWKVDMGKIDLIDREFNMIIKVVRDNGPLLMVD